MIWFWTLEHVQTLIKGEELSLVNWFIISFSEKRSYTTDNDDKSLFVWTSQSENTMCLVNEDKRIHVRKVYTENDGDRWIRL